MVSYLNLLALRWHVWNAYPSFGSFVVFRLMYSSYSNVPITVSQEASRQSTRTVKLWMLFVKRQLRPEKGNVLFDQLVVSYFV
jgi:hypothetical protein